MGGEGAVELSGIFQAVEVNRYGLKKKKFPACSCHVVCFLKERTASLVMLVEHSSLGGREWAFDSSRPPLI